MIISSEVQKMPKERCLCNTNWNVHMPHGVNRYYSWVGPWFYPFRWDEKVLGITPWAVTSKITVCGNIGFLPSSGVKGKEGRRELQEEEWLVSKLGNIILLENGLHLCYRVLVKSLVAGIVTNCALSFCAQNERLGLDLWNAEYPTASAEVNVSCALIL